MKYVFIDFGRDYTVAHSEHDVLFIQGNQTIEVIGETIMARFPVAECFYVVDDRGFGSALYGYLYEDTRSGCGIMSYDRFEKLKGTQQKQPKREWTPWTVWDNVSCRIYYKTNGKNVKVKYRDKFGGCASCAPTDTFDLNKGIALAVARAKWKEAHHNLSALLECM